MIAKNVTLENLTCAAAATGVRIENHQQLSVTRHRFVLRLAPSHQWQRLNHTLSRRVAAVCWHGHRDFFRALFRCAPAAVVSTSRMGKTKYTADSFEHIFESTGYVNIGSMVQPCYYRNACEC